MRTYRNACNSNAPLSVSQDSHIPKTNVQNQNSPRHDTHASINENTVPSACACTHAHGPPTQDSHRVRVYQFEIPPHHICFFFLLFGSVQQINSCGISGHICFRMLTERFGNEARTMRACVRAKRRRRQRRGCALMTIWRASGSGSTHLRGGGGGAADRSSHSRRKGICLWRTRASERAILYICIYFIRMCMERVHACARSHARTRAHAAVFCVSDKPERYRSLCADGAPRLRERGHAHVRAHFQRAAHLKCFLNNVNDAARLLLARIAYTHTHTRARAQT